MGTSSTSRRSFPGHLVLTLPLRVWPCQASHAVLPSTQKLDPAEIQREKKIGYGYQTRCRIGERMEGGQQASLCDVVNPHPHSTSKFKSRARQRINATQSAGRAMAIFEKMGTIHSSLRGVPLRTLSRYSYLGLDFISDQPFALCLVPAKAKHIVNHLIDYRCHYYTDTYTTSYWTYV